MKSAVLIIPLPYMADGNEIAVFLGHDESPGKTYVIPLSSNGNNPATHYGCRAWISEGFEVLVDIAKTGTVPNGTSDELAETALFVRSRYTDAISNLIFDARETDDPFGHFVDAALENGLFIVEPVVG